MHLKYFKMKTKTEIVLTVLKYLALLGSIGFSIECGAQLVFFVTSFVRPELAVRVYKANAEWIQVSNFSIIYFSIGMTLVILISVFKATIWYLIFVLLQKIQIHTPFSMAVTKRLEMLAYLLLAIWIFSGIFLKTYFHYLAADSGINLQIMESADEYFFIAGIVYIISQIFKRGIEMQEENQLTV